MVRNFVNNADNMEVLNSPLYIGKKRAENRIVYQAMEGCDGLPNGAPGELTRRRYLRFASGGPAIIWVEAVAVCCEGKANPRQLMLTEETKKDFAALVQDIKHVATASGKSEPLVIIQLTHSGRQSKPGGVPSPLIAYHNELFEKTCPVGNDRVISDEYLDGLQELYVKTALLAEECGFDGVDIKCCHGYLLNELLSAYNRPGKYGGTLENRSRMLIETARKVRLTLSSDMIISVRLGIFDGLEPEKMVELFPITVTQYKLFVFWKKREWN